MVKQTNCYLLYLCGLDKLCLIVFLALVLILVACSPTAEPTTESVIRSPQPTPTSEPTFTPSPSPTDTPTPPPTDTPTPEPTLTPTPEQASLSGLIFDQDTNQPIAEAQVSAGTASTTTDTDGGYTLTGLPPGQYVLSVTHPDYDPGLSGIFTVAAGKELSLDLPLYAPDTSPYPQDPMLTNPLDPNGAPTKEDAERLAREQGLTGEVVSINETTLTGEYLINYKIGDEVRAAVAELNHEVWELTDDTGRKWWIIKVCGNLASPLPAQKPIPTPKPVPLPPMAEVVVDELIVRACASEECAEVETVPRGTQVEVFGCLAEGEDWCEVGWSGGRGWCTGQSLRQLAVVEAVPVVDEAVLPTATPEIVAGGGKIAFVSERDDNKEIYVMNSDGSDLMRLTNDPSQDWGPTWSPDGQRIAFTSRRDGNGEIYVMNADGSNLINLTNHPSGDQDPVWSPDGQHIAFISFRGGYGTEVYLMNADGTDQRSLTNDTGNGSPNWSPDGQWVVFSDMEVVNSNTTYSHIHVIKADGSGLARLTNSPTRDGDPVWSPDGRRIAFSRREGDSTNIYIINADGGGLTRLIAGGSPTWSPDGRQIVFARGGDIYMMSVDGTEVIRLTDHPALDYGPDWSR